MVFFRRSSKALQLLRALLAAAFCRCRASLLSMLILLFKGVKILKLPDYIGPCAFGIKMGVIVPNCDLPGMILKALQQVDQDQLLSEGDALCITESIVARAENNYVTTAEAASEIREKLALQPHQKIGVLFPILSRNRFSLILRAIAETVPQGEVIVQLSYPDDEVGNQLIPHDVAERLQEEKGDFLTPDDLGRGYTHPLTGVNYIALYRDVISQVGAHPTIYLSNDPVKIAEYAPDAVIAADIHKKEKTKKHVASHVEKVITLQEICNMNKGGAWSQWGLLGSNMSSGNKLKLAPREGDKFASDVQALIHRELGKSVEVIIYGDGAYKDPSSGIYELADPQPAFGATPDVKGVLREGVKFKYLVDLHHEDGKCEEEIMDLVSQEAKKKREVNCITAEGTTPRRMEDVLSSLADLISGSADAGTPMVLVKGIYSR